MSDNKEVETTGHVWDEDLQEYNNPLPRWWLWTFYATIIFSLVYWVMYPTFPIGKSYNKGMNTITYTDNKGNEQTVPWNTRYLLLKEMKDSPAAKKQAEFLKKIEAASYDDIVSNPDMMAFTNSVAKGIFGDNCAGCHQAGGAGVPGLYPNLADDSWLYGGTFEQIHTTITNGRKGNMPEHGSRFSDAQITDIANYIVSLSGGNVDKAAAERGGQLYKSTAACFACHGQNAEGNPMIGAPNLSDQIWTIAKIFPNTADADKIKMVAEIIKNGAGRQMPAWKDRLSEADIKVLTVYVHELGGGK